MATVAMRQMATLETITETNFDPGCLCGSSDISECASLDVAYC